MFSKNSFLRTIVIWLPLGIVITLICAFIYFLIQKEIRTSANDPQIQIAQDTVISLETDGSYVNNLPTHVDIAKNLSPYIIVIDDNYKIISSNATLDGTSIIPPPGVLEYAKQNGRNILTWQPKVGVRSAIVVVRFEAKGSSGYVVVGRSLSEAELRKSNLLIPVFLGWIFIMIASFIAVFFAEIYKERFLHKR